MAVGVGFGMHVRAAVGEGEGVRAGVSAGVASGVSIGVNVGVSCRSWIYRIFFR